MLTITTIKSYEWYALPETTLFVGDLQPELKHLMRLEIADWYNVGLQLDLDNYDLYSIEKSHREFGTQRRKMFTLWLNSDPEPSYHKLARALFLAKENKIAMEICREHGKILTYQKECKFNSVYILIHK